MFRSLKARAAAGFVVALSAGMVVGVAGPASAASNAENAKLCQQGGWESLYSSTGASFKNAGDCVSYAAAGGQFFSVPACFNSAGFLVADTALVAGPLDTLNNVENYRSTNGSCAGSLLGYTTWVYATDAAMAEAKCQAITGTGTNGRLNDSPAFIPTAPSDWWWCALVVLV